jgi:hypothetical protein
MEDSEKLEKAETQQVEENPQEQETTEEIKVEGNDIIINGEKYDPERALNLIKKLRPAEKDLTKAQKELETYKLKEAEEAKAKLSEVERLKFEKQEADQKVRELTLKEQRREIAEKVKLPFALADRIKGETPEEMEADAKALFESLPKPIPKTGITNPGAQATETPIGRLHADIDPFNPDWVKTHGGGAVGI